MGTPLNGLQISNTYEGLLKTTDNAGLTTSLKTIGTGDGDDSVLQLSTTSASFGGTVFFTNTVNFNGATILNTPFATTTYVDTQVGNEETARINADNALSSSISTNTSNISTNTTNIATNTSNISTNTSNISTNTTDIATNTSNISTNTSNIATNTSNISTNTSNIATNTSNISTNTSNIATNTTDITNLQNGVNNVISVNTFDGDITITGGTGIGVVNNAGTITLNATGTAGVTSLEGLTGGLTFSGTNIDITTSGTDTIVLSASTGGGGGVTINNNTDGYLLTATGTANTIDGESKLNWNSGTQTLKIESSNNTNGLTLDGGVFGAANPRISAVGFTGIDIDKNLILTDQTKIAFDTDAVNTYIAADLTTPENLTINADGYVDVFIADGFRVWENNSAPAPIFRVDKSGDFPRVGIGANVTTTNSELYVDGKVEAKEYFYNFNNAALNYQGETISLGTTTTTAGQLYAWNGTSWVLADADVENTARALLGIAVANTSDKGMLINGWYKMATGYASGQLYMSATAGSVTTTIPSTTGQFVRVIGHGINSTTIRFNPSNEYYTVE